MPAGSGRRARTADVLVLLLVLTGCAFRAGTPASESTWASDTDKALGAALSSLGTAELVLENQVRGHLPDKYVAVALRDTVTTLQTATSSYLLAQPPSSRESANTRAIAAIQATVVVLNRATTTGSPASRAAVERQYDEIQELQTELAGR
jgi:hypothetical protein